MGLWIALVWLIWVSISPALAEVYRWTDDAGRIHLTDNPDSIPPAYRARARASGPGAPATEETPTGDAQPSPPQSLPPTPPASAPSAAPLAQQIAALEQQITKARQERQTYLEQLSSERAVSANPLLVRQRRQMTELGQALLTVEQQLDTLQVALEQAQQRLQDRLAPSPEQGRVMLDQAGHDATYWQQRVTTARERMQQAQMQRRDLLTRFATAIGGEQSTAGLQGRDVLQLAQALLQIEQEIDAAEATLQAVRQEALQAGAPRAWLQ